MVNGAGNGTRTRNLQLGRLPLYQLSYSRLRLFAWANIATADRPPIKGSLQARNYVIVISNLIECRSINFKRQEISLSFIIFKFGSSVRARKCSCTSDSELIELTRPNQAFSWIWWREKDSNLRRQSQRIYSPSPLTARESRLKCQTYAEYNSVF